MKINILYRFSNGGHRTLSINLAEHPTPDQLGDSLTELALRWVIIISFIFDVFILHTVL